jgi:hypothetical protein
MLRHLLLNPSRYTHHLLHQAGHLLGILALYLALPMIVLAAFLTAVGMLIRSRRRARVAANARQVMILAPPQASPEGGLVLWANLTGLLRSPWRRLICGQPHLGFEYAWTDTGARISVWVPGTIPPGLVERAAEAAWPGALTRTSPAVPPVPPGAAIEAGTLRLARPDHYPLRSDHDADPLRALFAAAEGLGPGETVLWQVLARPVAGPRLLRARRAATQLSGGGPPRPASRLLDLLTPGITRQHRRPPPASAFPDRPAEIRAILGKAAGPRWAVTIRYAVTAPKPADDAEMPTGRARLRGRAHALASAAALYSSGRNYLARRPLRHPGTVLAARRIGRGQLLSIPELAALAHLPLDQAVPGLARAGARAVPPPPDIPAPGRDALPLGEADAGIPRMVAIGIADARHHIHVIGETGVGKSTLLANMVLADARARRGAVVIDPSGDLINDLLERLPAEVGPRTVLFDPGDAGPPPSLNVLGGPEAVLVVDHLVGIFRKIFIEFWGPRTDDILRSACLTLAGRDGATLADIPALLGDTGIRQHITAGVTDQVLRGFWDWYDSLSDAHRGFITGPLMNKLRAFLLRPFVRQTVTASTSSFDMGAALDGGLILCRLPKGELGEDTSRLLGSVILANAWQTATHRARTSQASRKDTHLVIDECHNFLSLPHGMEDMLAEARKYNLSLTLVHQDLAQLSRELREGISANARNKVFFAISPEDARALERHVLPGLGAHDLCHLGDYQAAARLLTGGAAQPAFTMHTLPLPPAIPGRAGQIREAARAAAGGTASSHDDSQPLPGTGPVTDPRLDDLPPGPGEAA